MVCKVSDILLSLERIAPVAAAEAWDNPGLQVGRPSQEVRKIMVALDPTLDAVREACRRNARLLLTHHPLIFPSLSSLNQETHPGDVIFEAVKNEIAIVAAHTNLDVAQGGINDMLASLVQLRGVEVLQKTEFAAGPLIGMGRIGDLPEPSPLLVFASKVKTLLNVEGVRVGRGEKEPISRVAVVGGSGGSLVPLASAMGAHVLVTGDVGHHDALRARTLGMALIDAGHFHTEKKAFSLFANRFKDFLAEEGWDVTLEHWQEEGVPLQWVGSNP